jgi:hypothetical protein
MQMAIEVAQMFATQADEENRSQPLGDGCVVWLSKKQAEWLLDLWPKEGHAYQVREGFGLDKTEKFREIKKGRFSAKLLNGQKASGAMRLFYRWNRGAKPKVNPNKNKVR